MYAKVKYGIVEIIEEADVVHTRHPSLHKLYFPCDNTVKAGDIYDYETGTYSSPKPIIIPDHRKIVLINHEAYERIRQIMPEWMTDREVTGGKPVPQDIKDEAARLRAVSNVLCISLPDDYLEDIHWDKPLAVEEDVDPKEDEDTVPESPKKTVDTEDSGDTEKKKIKKG